MTPQAAAICCIAGPLLLLWALRGFQRTERTLIGISFLLHVLAAIAIVFYHEHVAVGGGDMLAYRTIGHQIARTIEIDPVRWGGETLKLALHQPSDLPVEVMLPGTSTGTMCAFSGLIMFFTGDALYGACLLVSFFSFLGAVSMCEALKPLLRTEERIPAMYGVLFLPSVLFWTGGLVKEAFVFGFLGIALRGLLGLASGFRLVWILQMFVGFAGIVLVKPYVLVALALAVGAWFLGERQRRIKIGYQVAGALAVIASLIAVARFFPEFSPENIVESMSRSRQSYAFARGGGSNVELGDDSVEPSLAGQLKWVPVGLLNTIARPFIFEANNGAMLLAALEITVLLGLVGALLFAHGPRRILRAIRDDRLLRAIFVLILTFGTSIGLATKNLGTLSRYRVPMMPAYAAGVLILQRRLRLPLSRPSKSYLASNAVRTKVRRGV